MRTLFGRFLVGFALLALAGGTAAAQSEGGKLEVSCVDENGKPVKDVQVFLQQRQGSAADNGKTNKRGIASFKKVQGGIYRVMARGEGYEPALVDLYRFPGDGEHTLELKLKAGDSEKKLYFEDDTLAQKANQLINEAVKAFQEKDFETAEAKLKESLEIFPSNPVAQQNLGLIYLSQQRWEDAKAALEKAVDLLGYYIDMNVPDMEKSRQQIQNAIDSIPLQKIAVQTEELMKERRYEEAIPLFEKMKEMSPDNADVYYNMAVCLARAERIDDAKAAIAKALELRPTDQLAQKLQQQILEIEESGRSMKAQEAIQAIEEKYKAGKYEEALQDCDKAFETLEERFHGSVWILKARSYAKLGKADEAISAYLKAVEMKPDDQGLKEELADVYIAAERYQEGIDLYSQVLGAKSEAADKSFFDMAQNFNSKGKADLAGMLFKKVLEINPDFAEAYYQLGIYYFYEKKDREQAKKMLNKYLEIGQDQNNKDNATAILTVMEKTK